MSADEFIINIPAQVKGKSTQVTSVNHETVESLASQDVYVSNVTPAPTQYAQVNSRPDFSFEVSRMTSMQLPRFNSPNEATAFAKNALSEINRTTQIALSLKKTLEKAVSDNAEMAESNKQYLHEIEELRKVNMELQRELDELKNATVITNENSWIDHHTSTDNLDVEESEPRAFFVKCSIPSEDMTLHIISAFYTQFANEENGKEVGNTLKRIFDKEDGEAVDTVRYVKLLVDTSYINLIDKDGDISVPHEMFEDVVGKEKACIIEVETNDGQVFSALVNVEDDESLTTYYVDGQLNI